MDRILLFVLLALQVLTLAGVALVVWSGRRTGRPTASQLPDDNWRREFRGLERYIEGKVDLLLGQILNQKPAALNVQELAAALALRPAAAVSVDVPPERSATKVMSSDVKDPELPIPVPFQEGPGHEASRWSGEGSLMRVLSSSSFLQGVWPGMEGPYDEAARKVRDHFGENGLAEPHIEAYPPAESGGVNHWLFLVVTYREPQAACPRFLIPRNFSRYDPLVHDHLFQIMGARGGVDYFIRELRECALLEAVGELKGFIMKDLVVKKGVFVV